MNMHSSACLSTYTTSSLSFWVHERLTRSIREGITKVGFCNHCVSIRQPEVLLCRTIWGSSLRPPSPSTQAIDFVRFLCPFHAKWRVTLKYFRYLEHSIFKSPFLTLMPIEKPLISPIKAPLWHLLYY